MDDDMLPTPTTSDSRVQKPAHSNSLPATASSSSASTANLNPRSCVTCRRRKVKCDKRQPCTNCARAKIECMFPGPGRTPRKARRPPDGELLDRLRRLEGVVQSLNVQVEEHEQEAAEREQRGGSSGEAVGGIRDGGGKSEEAEGGCPTRRREREEQAHVVVDNSVEGLETRFGRLVVDQGRSRYVNNSFWASLNNEVEDLKSILIENENEESTTESPDSNSARHDGFIFGYSSSNVDMLALHPTIERAREYWTMYKLNVDPLVKVLHINSFESVFLDAISHPETVAKSLEPLMFTIYYGAVTSTTPEDCVAKWGETQDELLKKYRFGVEQALARANFMFCDEIIILQAFVVFMILLRRNDDARKIWTLTGLAVRIAQTLGIHRDGSHFHLKPFEIEMRRRLWWQVYILDTRASEDHGCDPTIVESQFDTKMPLNVNDSDIDPDMVKFPPDRQGFTDMSFCLTRFEVSNISRRILYIPPGPNHCNQFFTNLTVPEKERWISDCHQRLEDKYLKNSDMSIPLCWITATVSRLVMSKMWLIVYHPYQRKDGGRSLPQETKDKLFITSLENVEYSILIETEARTMQWGWLFRTYVQWHAVAFLLSELCVRTKGEAVERAWRALDATAGRWWFPLGGSSTYTKSQPSCLWKPLYKVMAKARAARERDLALERASQALRNEGVPQAIPSFSASSTNGANDTNKPNNPENPLDINHPQISPLDTFNSLSEQGLDFLLGDVMEGYALDDSGRNINNANHDPLSQFIAPNLAGNGPPPSLNRNTSSTDSPRAVNTLSCSMDGNTSGNGTFAQSPLNMNMNMNGNGNTGFDGVSGPAAGVNAGHGYSPVLENGMGDLGAEMDWAGWDDMVSQFGMEGWV
ncbi:hypothetical protein CC80DRAFT_526443 [Byssothecium circinans]|uniref:Zn(2)-C6 fungal-type domain-containing protein n=1 Tax=Byssothecium circinans TaxID=147558 RepID=A0A6A5TWG7_9PLEO|nr:hypothetical protein CC80DRAFT_526443 [Byssothecium circinans]